MSLPLALTALTARRIDFGESLGEISAIRRVTALRVGIDAHFTGEGDTRWTNTSRYELGADQRSLPITITREDGKLVTRRSSLAYRRCS